jgi:hypothetical protein
VGVVFAAGCILPAWNRAEASGRGELIVVGALFAALACLNCFAIERWESSQAGGSVLRVALSTMLAQGATAALIGARHPRPAALLVAGAAAALLLAILDCSRGRLTPLALRAAADFVLLTPVVLLWR